MIKKLGEKGREAQRQEAFYRGLRYIYELPFQTLLVVLAIVLSTGGLSIGIGILIGFASLCLQSIIKYKIAPYTRGLTVENYRPKNTKLSEVSLAREQKAIQEIEEYMSSDSNGNSKIVTEFKESLRSQKNLFNPEKPYQGMGILFHILEISNGEKVLSIDKIYEKRLQRFSYYKTNSLNDDEIQKFNNKRIFVDQTDLESKLITSIKCKNSEGYYVTYDINQICKSANDSDDAKLKIISLLRDSGEIFFKLYGEDGLYSCIRDNKSIFNSDLRQYNARTDGIDNLITI